MRRKKSSRAHQKMVLIVEDDPALRTLITVQLKGMDFASVACADGRSAMKELAKRKFDLVCMDLMLPEISGYDMCEHIRKELKLNVPILIMSARALPSDRAYAEEVGASAYLTKPFTADQLVSSVHDLLELTSPWAEPLE